MRGRRAARKMLRLAYAPPPVHHGVLTQFAPLLAALFPARWFQTTPAAARGRGRVHSKKSGITKGVEQGNIKAQYQVYINPFHFPVTFVSPESHTHHSVSLLSLFIHFPTENAASTTSGPIWSCILLLELCHFS
jgi:hypothetical protein